MKAPNAQSRGMSPTWLAYPILLKQIHNHYDTPNMNNIHAHIEEGVKEGQKKHILTPTMTFKHDT